VNVPESSQLSIVVYCDPIRGTGVIAFSRKLTCWEITDSSSHVMFEGLPEQGLVLTLKATRGHTKGGPHYDYIVGPQRNHL
jgi:hypothetical protein